MTSPRPPMRKIPLDPHEEHMVEYDEPLDQPHEPVWARVPPAWTWLVAIGLGLAVVGGIVWLVWRWG